jgi:hypothetical protein
MPKPFQRLGLEPGETVETVAQVQVPVNEKAAVVSVLANTQLIYDCL